MEFKPSKQDTDGETAEENDKTETFKEFTKARLIKNLVLVSFTCLISFTASEGLNFLQSTMNKDVGLICFAVQYTCGVIASLLLPKYLIKKFGSKLVLVVTMFAYVPHLSSNYYPVFAFMVPTSIIVGFASSLVFNAVCTYVNDLAFLYTKLCLRDEGQIPDLDPSPDEKKLPKYTLKESPQLYNSIRKHKDSIFITKQSLFDENGAFPTGTPKEIALIEFKHGSTLNGRNSKKQLIKGEHPSQEKNDISKNKVQNILKKNCGSFKHMTKTKQNSLMSEDINKSLSVRSQESKSPENGRSAGKKMFHLNSVPEEAAKAKDYSRNDQKEATDVATSDRSRLVLETTTSRFFGFFGCIYQSCHIVCNVISHVIFYRNTAPREYIRNSSCVCGPEFCSMDPACVVHNLEGPSNQIRYTVTTVYVVMSFLSALITLLFLDNLSKKRSKVSFTFDLAITAIKLHKNKNQLFLVPLCFYIGIIQAFATADFTKDYIGCAWGVEHVSLVLLSAGFGISVFSGLYGLLEKHIGRYVFFGISAAMNFAAIVTMLIWIPDSSAPVMMFVVSGMIGAVIGIMWCQIKSFIGLIFKEEEETAYGNYQLWHSLGCALAYAYANYICTDVKMYIILVVSTLAVVGYILAERDYRLNKKPREIT